VTGKAPAGAVRARLYLRLTGGSYVGAGGGVSKGRVVWDDVTLQASAPSAQDPSFESWPASNSLSDWSFGTQAGGALSHTYGTDWHRSGGSAAATTCPTGDASKVSDLTQLVTVTAGYTYSFGVWAVTDRNPSAVQLHLQFLDQAGKALSAPWTSGDKWGLGGGAWTRLLVTGKAPAGAVRARLYLRLTGGSYVGAGGGVSKGRVVWDDVTLETISDSVAPTTTPSGADSAWHSAPVTVTFSASDNPGGSGVARTEYKLDAGAWTTGTSCTVPAPATHAGDGEHTVSYRSVDAAGNVEAAKSVTVRIDTTAPQGSFTLAAGAATTTTAQVSASSAVTDAHGPLTMRLSTDGKASWSAWGPYAQTQAVTLPGAPGAKTVHAQYRDAAGNLTELSDQIELLDAPADRIGPLTYAKAAAGRVGRYVSLRYRVTDDQSSLVWDVRLVVRNARGRTVKSFTTGAAGFREAGVWHAFRWKPKARGVYRYSVYAKDAAGNAQSRVGSARVVVR
jgi:hypothetical protein